MRFTRPAYEALVVAVKFGLAPYGLYHVNEHVAITESLFGIDDAAAGATATAAVIFALYFAVYGLLYLWARRGVTHLERAARSGPGTNRLVPTAAVVVSVLGLGAGGWVLVIAAAQPAAQYLDFVFSSAVAVFTGVALAGATALAAMVFRSTARQETRSARPTFSSTFSWWALCSWCCSTSFGSSTSSS